MKVKQDSEYILDPKFGSRLASGDPIAWISAYSTLYPDVFTPSELKLLFVTGLGESNFDTPRLSAPTHPVAELQVIDAFTGKVRSRLLEMNDFLTPIILHREDLPHQRL